MSMQAYSDDLRQRIVQAVETEGMSQPAVAARFAVSVRSVERYLAQWRATGTLAAGHAPGATPAIAPAQYPLLIAQLTAHPDDRLEDHCTRWQREQGCSVSTATMSRTIRRVGWTVKKNGDRQRTQRGDAARLAGGRAVAASGRAVRVGG